MHSDFPHRLQTRACGFGPLLRSLQDITFPGPSQLVLEAAQAAGRLRNLTYVPEARGPGRAWLWTLQLPFTDGFSLGSAWPAGETSQPLLVPQRRRPLCNPSQGLSVSVCSSKFGVWTDLVGNGCWAGPWTTGIRRANTRIMILPALTHETNIR